MYRMECVKINTLWSGEIDCDDFKAKLLCHKDKPAIVNVNIGNFLLLCFSLWLFPVPSLFSFWFWLSHWNIAGTTVKGAVDDLDLVIKKLEEAGFSQDRFYIHCDGALFGLMLPFVKRVSLEMSLFYCSIFLVILVFSDTQHFDSYMLTFQLKSIAMSWHIPLYMPYYISCRSDHLCNMFRYMLNCH